MKVSVMTVGSYRKLFLGGCFASRLVVLGGFGDCDDAYGVVAGVWGVVGGVGR